MEHCHSCGRFLDTLNDYDIIYMHNVIVIIDCYNNTVNGYIIWMYCIAGNFDEV